MAFIQHMSVTAQQPVVKKARLVSKVLPGFSKLQNKTSPFFVQWLVTALDIVRIHSVNYHEALQKMQAVRSYYSKSKHDVVTIEEYCAFTGAKKGLVRMHVMSRKMENELKRKSQQFKNGNGKGRTVIVNINSEL